MLGYLTRRTGDPVLAEEIAQETFAKAAAAFGGRRDGHPLGWLLAIARNCLADHHRRGRRLVPLDSELLDATAFPDLSVEVADLLRRLPEPDRRLLQWVYLDGFTHAEIAQVTGRSPAAVRTAVWRARDALRASLGGGRDDRR